MTRKSKTRKVHPPSDREVRRVGIDCETLEAAAAQLKYPDLGLLLTTDPKLQAAWDRGRLLRRVYELATQTLIVPEAADKRLDLPPGAFLVLLNTDPVLRTVWRDGRHQARLEMEKAAFLRAKNGDAGAATILEKVFGQGETAVHQTVDFQRLTPTQMEIATGFLRQTILRWAKTEALPRNADGSYSVPRFIEWFRKHELDKLAGTQTAMGLNPFQQKKAEKLEMDLSEARGRLVSRNEVMAGIMMRYRRLAQARQRAPDVILQMAEQPPERMEQILTDFLDDLCSRQIEDYGELRLPEPAGKMFTDLLELLKEEA